MNHQGWASSTFLDLSGQVGRPVPHEPTSALERVSWAYRNSALASRLIQESCLKQDGQPETLTPALRPQGPG